MPKSTCKSMSPTVLEYTLGIKPKTPQPRPKVPKKAFTMVGLEAVMRTMVKANRPMRFHEIVKDNLGFANTTGLLKAARELVKQGKLSVSKDKDGNIYSLPEP